MPGVHSIAYMGDINDGETEGDRLERLLAGRVRAEFARDHDIRGGPSMIAQHVSGNRPISLEAAIAYCKGLGTTLDKLSPRLAALVRSAGHHLDANRPQPLPLDALLDQFGTLLAAVPQQQRDAAAQALAGWTIQRRCRALARNVRGRHHTRATGSARRDRYRETEARGVAAPNLHFFPAGRRCASPKGRRFTRLGVESIDRSWGLFT